MAKGNKKRTNRSRVRAAIHRRMAETGQSYTACLRQGGTVQDVELTETPSTNSGGINGRQLPLPRGLVDAIAASQAQRKVMTEAMALFGNPFDPVAEVHKGLEALQQARQLAMIDPAAEVHKGLEALQQARQLAMIDPAAEVKNFFAAWQTMR